MKAIAGGSHRWVHGFDNWKWDDEIKCWFHKGSTEGHDYYCLGDRMFHGSFGLSKGDVVYHGSYADNWHGGIQTRHLDEALAWLHRAEGTSNWAWSK